MSFDKKNRSIEPNSNSSETLKEKINRLNKNIELCRKYKEETIRYVQRLEEQYKRGIFNYAEYEYMLNRYLKGYTLDYWMRHYEDNEKKIKEKIRSLRLQKQKTVFEKQSRFIEKRPKIRFNYKFLAYSLIVFLLIIGMPVMYQTFLSGSKNLLTGFSVLMSEQENISLNHVPVIEDYTPEENPVIKASESQTFAITSSDPDNDTLSIRWYVNILPVADQTSDSFTFTPTEPGEFEIKVLVHDFQDYTSHKWALTVSAEENITYPQTNEDEEAYTILPEENISEETFEENETAEDITLPETNETLPESVTEPEAEPTLDDITTPDNVTGLTESEENITLPIISAEQMPAEINKPVQWVIKAKRTNETYLEVELPAQAGAIFVEKIVKDTTVEKKEEVPKEKLTIKKGSLSINLPTYELTEQSVTGFFIANVQKEGALSTVTDWTSFRFFIYKTSIPIREALSKVWKVIKEPSLTAFATIGVEEKIILLIEDDAKEFEIRYQTPAPKIKERTEGNRKFVTVYSDMSYTNILTYTKIKEDKRLLGVFWLDDELRLNIPYEVNDENSNGAIDKVSWITPHLSEQTFEIIQGDSYKGTIPVSNLTFLINCPGVGCSKDMGVPVIERGYMDSPAQFCPITNSKTKGLDLGALIEFGLGTLPGQYEIAELCLYASVTAKPIYEEGVPKIHVKEEDIDIDLLQLAIEDEMDSLPLKEVNNVPGWNCFDVTSVVKNAQAEGKTSLKLRIAGQSLKAKQRNQYACFRGIDSTMVGCSLEDQQGMPPDCRPAIRLY